jgi:hypothetical protein
MKKYRIKQVGDKFYPQYKKYFNWRHYKDKDKPQIFYNFMLEKFVDFEYLYFDSFEDANNFLIKEKKSDTIIYHQIKEI